nr:family 16 glycosylhydrolase [Metabacillus crassostreae]
MEKENKLGNESISLLECKVMKGERAGTVKIYATVNDNHHLAVKVSSIPLDIQIGDLVPTDRTVTNPYASGSDISGVDLVINKYIALFVVDEKNYIVSIKMITLTEGELESISWIKVWEDTFSNSHIDDTKWNYIIGGGGYGNNELQCYTNREKNARIEGNQLILEAHEENYQDNSYTSAKLTTKDKANWTYGRFSIKAKLPQGKGIWPAIWMMPADMSIYSGWPSCGEIDIMEIVGHEPDTVHGTIHYGNPHTYTGESYKLPNGENFSDDFHVYTLEWEPEEIRWYVNDVLFAKQSEWFTKSEDGEGDDRHAPFNREFYLQLNLAVGGDWPGNPDKTTVFPQKMIVDFVKVYRKS